MDRKGNLWGRRWIGECWHSWGCSKASQEEGHCGEVLWWWIIERGRDFQMDPNYLHLSLLQFIRLLRAPLRGGILSWLLLISCIMVTWDIEYHGYILIGFKKTKEIWIGMLQWNYNTYVF